MMLRLQRYDLQVEYEPGKNLYIADTLSRAPEGQNQTAANSKDEFEVLIIENMPVSEGKLEQFKQETRNYPTLQKLKNTVLNEWPESKSQSDPEHHGYWNLKEEITVCDDLLLRSDRLIVPDSLRGEMLSKIHSSHLGIGKCKRRARDVLFWPGMNQQITDMISKWNTCNTYRNAQAREPLKSHELPGRPCQKIAVDLFELDKQVVIVDYYSKFFEVSNLPNSKSKTVINHIKPHLARYGIPEVIISDNGPEFSSHEFEELAKHIGFKHITSSPTYSQSNGLVERAVQTAKNTLKKAKAENKDFHLALLDYRNTPMEEINLSPAQTLMGRRTRTRLPTTPSLLEPQYPTDNIKEGLRRRAEIQQQYYNRHGKALQPLNTGDTVRIRKPGQKTWTPAEVTKVTESPRYYVVVSDGTSYRRNSET